MVFAAYECSCWNRNTVTETEAVILGFCMFFRSAVSVVLDCSTSFCVTSAFCWAVCAISWTLCFFVEIEFPLFITYKILSLCYQCQCPCLRTPYGQLLLWDVLFNQNTSCRAVNATLLHISVYCYQRTSIIWSLQNISLIMLLLMMMIMMMMMMKKCDKNYNFWCASKYIEF